MSFLAHHTAACSKIGYYSNSWAFELLVYFCNRLSALSDWCLKTIAKVSDPLMNYFVTSANQGWKMA